ncbi:MAG TPA: DUF2911 domain-containing protein [Candidatus Paceibacterota bacterium]|nr:DUF2911 domain-containing protein [Candidatus Paceibacterota bacterium]
MKRLLNVIAAAAVLFTAIGASAQQKRVSPPDVTGAVIDGNRVTVYYSRPSAKKPGTQEERKIWGGLVPYGKVWRTGANEATLLVTQKPIVFGETTVPAGAYTLFTLPQEDGSAKLIINKQIGQWGVQYDQKQDLVRVDMKKESLEKPVEQFTMSVDKNPAGGGLLKLSWENAQYSAPFTVQK